MWKTLFAMLIFCGISAYAQVKTFDYPDYRIYAIQDAPTCPSATLFFSVDPKERFIQTKKDYSSSVNVFIIEYKKDKRRFMIDTGFGTPKGKLLDVLRRNRIDLATISGILITHIHPDHVGGLRDFPQAKVYIAKDEYKAWEQDSSRRRLAMYMPNNKNNLILFDYNTELIPKLKAIKAEGHTPGHTVFQIDHCYFVGDILHAVDLQIDHPAFCARYDMNPEMAAESRKKALQNFKGDWFGAHITYPGKRTNAQ